MKKLTAFLIALLFTLSVPFTSTFAAAGVWDNMGTYTMKFNTGANRFLTPIVNSTGGDFKFCANNSLPGVNTYVLWESDPDGGYDNDDWVGTVKLYNGDCAIFRSIGRFVDGDNKRAEFYVAALSYSARISMWD